MLRTGSLRKETLGLRVKEYSQRVRRYAAARPFHSMKLGSHRTRPPLHLCRRPVEHRQPLGQHHEQVKHLEHTGPRLVDGCQHAAAGWDPHTEGSCKECRQAS